MPRTGRIPKRQTIPDPIFSNLLVTKLINNVMVDGKKSLAERIVYRAFKKIERETDKNPVLVFEDAVKAVTPKAEVRPRRVGGATYMVPLEVRGDRAKSLAVKWIVAAARGRSAKEHLNAKLVMAEKLAAEILAAATSSGGAMTKKSQIEKQAEANKAFSHFRW